ncbi:MAG: outer membrane beta-barrel domain-containing protein [Gammaproteobacteria bacterium]
MEVNFRGLLLRQALLACCLLALSGGVSAEDHASSAQVIDPEVDRREIRRARIDTEDFEVGGFVGLMSVEDFGTNAVYGVSFAYHINEAFFVEAVYGATDTDPSSVELSNPAPILSDSEREYRYYNASLAWNVLPGEAFFGANRALNTAFYLVGGIGSTDFAGDDHFTLSYGFGYRVLPNDWISLRLEARDHMFDLDVLGEDKTTHNLEGHLAVTFFF